MKYVLLIALVVVCVVALISCIKNIKVLIERKKEKQRQTENNTDTIIKEVGSNDCSKYDND